MVFEIKQELAKYGITAKDVANTLDIPYQRVARLFNKEKDINVSMALIFATVVKNKGIEVEKLDSINCLVNGIKGVL